MSFKRLFAKSLAAAPGRLHVAAHSHHLWPDASFDGHQLCWLDASALADRKWDKVMGEVWPDAQGHVAAELGVPADRIVFSSNTHDFLVRLFASAPRRAGGPLRVLTSDGEFHSARRQLSRLEDDGLAIVTRVAAEPFDSFSDRFMAAATQVASTTSSWSARFCSAADGVSSNRKNLRRLPTRPGRGW